ncbi:MAG: 4Fe-4S binding protein [Syntrophobacteraceae bacterium]|jgi:2-oxoglutarate ferredoxin oxidoreductase subunit delta
MESDQQKGNLALRRKSGGPNQSEKGKRVTARNTKPKKSKRFEIDIFRDWCKSCGICAAFCPRECIMLDDDGAPTKVDSDRCTGCGWCELHCPDFAISVHQRDEKAGTEDV